MRGANYGWPNCEGTCASSVHQPDLLLCAQRPRCSRSPAGSSTTAPSSRRVPGELLLRRLRAELDQAADLRRQRQRHRRLQLRAGRRRASTGRTATSSTSPRVPTARSTTSTSATPTSGDVRRQQDPPHPLHRNRTSRRRRSLRPTRRRAGAADRRLLECRLVGSRGPALTYAWTSATAPRRRRPTRPTPTRQPGQYTAD